MRRTPLSRHKALKRSRIVRKLRYTGPSLRVRRIVRQRAGDVCEWPGCQRIGTDYQHRLNRKMGGRYGTAREQVNTPAGVLLVCRADHDWLHSNPREAYAMGWLIHEGEDPREVPVLMDGGSFWLDDDGGKTPVDGAP